MLTDDNLRAIIAEQDELGPGHPMRNARTLEMARELLASRDVVEAALRWRATPLGAGLVAAVDLYRDAMGTSFTQSRAPRETSASIAQWQRETFGEAKTDPRRLMETRAKLCRTLDGLLDVDLSSPRPNLSRAIRAAEEMAELIDWLVKDDDAAKAPWECADISIVLDGIIAAHCMERADLVDRKMVVNRGRKWNTTGDGHGQHVRGDGEP